MDPRQGLREAFLLRRLSHQLGECESGWDCLELAANLESLARLAMMDPEPEARP